MTRSIGLAIGTTVLAFATPLAAQQRGRGAIDEDEGGAEEAASPLSAAERAVWNFVHFTSGAEIVDVIDAFDGEDPFDVNLSVGYLRTFKRAKIVRECRGPMSPCGAGRDDRAGLDFIDYVDIARYTHEAHILDLLLAVGLYHDLQLYTRWPLILSDTRSLGYLVDDAGQRATVDEFIDKLFKLPFDSPERSGVDYAAVGFSWAPFNQERDPTDPNWVLNIEGRFAIGDEMKATRSGKGDGGISRRLNELRFAMYLSKRYRWIEPYTGITGQIGFPDYSAGYHFKNYFSGQINRFPPIEGSLLFGMEIVPWENLERFQKFSIGLDITGTYHSEGRTYAELFDALGTSEDPRLTYADGGPCYDPDGAGGPIAPTCWQDRWGTDKLYKFTGMTDIENYATFAGRLVLTIQAAKYVKFSAGVGFGHDTEHYVTFTDECNAGQVDQPGDCQVSGDAYNPMTREVIDAPGNRFRVMETTIFDVFLSVTAMF